MIAEAACSIRSGQAEASGQAPYGRGDTAPAQS
jgi:hypothetical protein